MPEYKFELNPTLKKQDPQITSIIQEEIDRQLTSINLIASENYASSAVLEATGTVLTNKYAEGYPGSRYYGGCEFVDKAEILAIERAKELFKVDHANVQAHSGTGANMAAYSALINPGDTVLGMSLDQGGHLSHGSPVNFSGKNYNFIGYGVDRDTEQIDFEKVFELATTHKPKIILAGYTAYPRTVEFDQFKKIAEACNAKLMVDMAHISGLIAGNAHPSPAPYADVITSTTHKTLRGPRGAMILSTEELGSSINRSVFPQNQGGPFMHVIAAKAIAFGEALSTGFQDYATRVVANSRKLAEVLGKAGLRIVSGGTDTHLFLVDVTPLGLTGRKAEEILSEVNIYVNRNAIPYDEKPPRVTSGMRIGTAAVTSRGMNSEDMTQLGNLIVTALLNHEKEGSLTEIKKNVLNLIGDFPVPGINCERGFPF
ncbi:MAG: serine hydroxymethyltransferase [Chloroflexi bacterium]|nr:serine hydroxymethyltransferase [Chloroflexota bacterium]|tara:strand:- start:13708 stop:14994 length:1287 start_codon:yes stop_codon:yes gene_type:complete